MRWHIPPGLVHGTLWSGWRRAALWIGYLAALFGLGALRTATDAEMAFASFAILPVLVIAWLGGRSNGLLAAVLAAATWALGDLASERQYSAAWIPWANAVARLMTYCIVAVLAAQVSLLFRIAHENSMKDSLTGLPNRRAFVEAGCAEVERSRRYASPLAVIFLDLDNFKKLNDLEGHHRGDDALRSTANALASALRSTDHLARLGGDEFAVLLPRTGHDEAAEVGRKLALAVNGALRPFAPVAASIGIAWFGSADRSFAQMLKAADELMYEAKESPSGAPRIRRFPAGAGHERR